MTTNLATIPDDELPIAKYDDSVFKDAVETKSWLPRIQLATSNSKLCNDGSFPINHYAFIRGSEPQDLGKTIDALVIAWRPKAMDFNGDSPVSVYDINSPQWADIKTRAGTPNSGCMFGVDFLIWLPTIKEYATLFMGSASARIEADVIRGQLKSFVTLTTKEIRKGNYHWWAISCISCSTPHELPSIDEIKEKLEPFNNPPVVEVEVAKEVTRER